MFSESFIVGFGSIGLYSGVVVLDLTGLSPTERDEQGQPTRELRQRIVMTPQAMLETFNAMQGLMARLEQAGLVKRADPTEQAGTPEAQGSGGEPKKPGGRGQPKTPNF